MTECDHRWERVVGEVMCSRCCAAWGGINAVYDGQDAAEAVRLSERLREAERQRDEALTAAHYGGACLDHVVRLSERLREAEEARKAAEVERDDTLIASQDWTVKGAAVVAAAQARGAARQREADVRWLRADSNYGKALAEDLAAQPLVTAQPEERE